MITGRVKIAQARLNQMRVILRIEPAKSIHPALVYDRAIADDAYPAAVRAALIGRAKRRLASSSGHNRREEERTDA